MVAQGHRQEEGIDYDEVFAPVARIEAIRLFLAYASYMDFTVYQMDVKSAFLYGTIEEEVYVNQPPGFEDPEFPNKVYKVEKALYGLHQAPRAWYETLSTYLLENGFRRGTIDKTLFIKKIKNDILLVQVYVDDIIFGSTKKSLSTEFEKLMHKRFQMSSMGELTFFLGLQVEQRKDGIFLSQDKYVYDILKKFGFTTVKTASTPMETHKSLSSNAAEPDVDVHLYRSMIGTLMYLTSSRPDIMFVVCACSRFQVTPKDSPIDMIAYSDSDYAGASIDRKSTTRGCQFLGSRLVSWQCKKQTIVANSTTEAEYIAASHCCGQVLWLQNQLLDYGYNFMRTKIHIDNESTISVIKNPISYSKKKHIEIRFHFIRDSYEKKLIEMVKIYTDNNVADLLTKVFDVTRFEFFIASIVDTSVPLVLDVNHTTNGHQFTMSNRYQELTSPKQTALEIAVLSTTEEGLQAISETIDGHEKLITKDSLGRHLKSSLSPMEVLYPYNSTLSQLQEECIGLIQYAHDEEQLQSPSRITSSPSLSQQPTQLSPSPEPIQPTHEVEETAFMPYDLPLHVVHSHGRLMDWRRTCSKQKKTYSTALTKLVLRVKKLEYKLKSGKARRKAKIVLSNDEEIAEDSSKQGKNIS
ncbi:putative ribonuclease H-like domain-containing protein [Tanacetum coccineum]